MRRTPISKWTLQAEKFDNGMQPKVFWASRSQSRAGSNPRLGGLGLRRIVDHADIAFSASWWEAKNTCGENWSSRDDVKSNLSQMRGSYKKDEEILKVLIEQARNQRDRQRLRRLQCEHSGAWVTAVPSTHDGNDTVMRPRNFQVAVQMRLGLPVLDEEKSCSLCKQIIDVFGDHAACCAMSSDRIHRHNRLRNLLERICHEGMLSPVLEKKGILGDVDGRRPGDVTKRGCDGDIKAFISAPNGSTI